jgi:PAS domain S-box-containing protein
MMKARLTGMTAGLAVGITAAVAVAFGAGAYLYSVHYFGTFLDQERRTALAQGELMRAALEHQMIENDRSLIADMVESFAKEPRIARVMLLDHDGIVQYANTPAAFRETFELGSPTCQACHGLPDDQRTASRVIETREGTMLRTMIPFRNREACYACHDQAQRINGLMLLDIDAGEMRADMNRDLQWMVAGSGALALVLIGALALIVRLVVVRRLQRFQTTARLIAQGDLDRRVPAEGTDTIAWLATEFNTMADSVTGLLGEVRTQRERLETVINSIDDGIVVLDARRTVVAANDAFLQRTGRVRPLPSGCSCNEVASGMCTAVDCPALACLRTGERQVRICERQGADGVTAWEEVHASPIRGASGDIAQVVEVWRDISNRRAAEARLAESHRLASLGLLASGFSHELNTPLATVLMCVEGILRNSRAQRDGNGEWSRVHESAGIAREQLLRCRGITQHFLRLSRGQAASADLIELQPIVTAVARLVEPTARANGVGLEVQAIAAGLHVRADEAELQHAMMNLMLNAIQACARGGRVSIGIEPGDPIRLRIHDDGCGIAPEHQQRIFEPFFSLRAGGTGLGLFLALNFVRHWQGDIAVTSAPGAGATFEVRLPAAAAVRQRPAS